MRRRAIVGVAALVLVVSAPAIATAVVTVTPSDGDDDKVTGQRWVRHDGGTDAAIAHCNNTATNPAADDNPNDDDIDSNDGGSRRQNNEPFSVVDPTDTDTIVTGWNDYCLTDLDAGWQGFGYSRDGGETWTNSFVPGYPQDTSAKGQESPLFDQNRFAGDPIAAFDKTGRLYVGGISFNFEGATNGHVYVATYSAADGPNNYPVTYEFTRIVGEGTPGRLSGGIFQDKPMLEVDRTNNADTEGNVYVCWSRFTGFGQNKLYISRSTDGGNTFSTPMQIHRTNEFVSIQGCDIAIEADGDVYVTFRTFTQNQQKPEGLAFVRSTDGGATFTEARLIRPITSYFPFDGTRDCGDGAFECPTEFVFARIPLEPRVTADQTGELRGVYLVYNEIDPTTHVDSTSSYTSAGPPGGGMVGQSQVYVIRTSDDGANWSNPIAVDEEAEGHQFFADIDAHAGTLGVVWQDSRTDDCYSVQRPMGNTAAAMACASDDVVNSFAAFSDTGTSFGSSIRLSREGHQPQYEMFSNRQIPFQGDYNWISIVTVDADTQFAYATWTDNRDVVTGTDPREETQDGFDVRQCRVEEEEGVFSLDNCANAGGLDQNIYGRGLTITT